MKNLRIVDSKVTTNTIEVYFNEKVTQNITAANFLLTSETIGTPDPVITLVEVRLSDPDKSKCVILNVSPLTYNSVYKLIIKSTVDNRFLSRDNQYILLEDTTEILKIWDAELAIEIYKNFEQHWKYLNK